MPYTRDGLYTYDGKPGWTVDVGSRLDQTAFHEAAHAVLGTRDGWTVHEISITPDQHSLGWVSFGPEARHQDPRERDREAFRELLDSSRELTEAQYAKLRRAIHTSLAGPLAASRLSGGPPHWGTDRGRAILMIRIYAAWDWQRMRHFLRQEQATVAARLRDPKVWEEVTGLAGTLLGRSHSTIA